MNIKHYKITFILSFVILIFFVLSTEHLNVNITGSHSYYVEMAANPLSVKSSPYAYRLLIPLIVNLIPTETGIAFFFLTYLLIALFLLLLHSVLIILFNDEKQVLLSILFIISSFFSIRYFIYNPYLIDIAVYVILLLLLKTLLQKKYALFFIVLTISIFVKESVLLMSPVFFIFNLKNQGFKKSFKLWLKYAAIPVVIYIIFRMISFNAYLGLDIIESAKYYIKSRGLSGFTRIFTLAWIEIFGVMIFVIISEFKSVLIKIKEQPYTISLFLLVLICPFFDTDVETSLFLAFPAIIIWFDAAITKMMKRLNKIAGKIVLISLFTIQFIINSRFIDSGVMLPSFMKDFILSFSNLSFYIMFVLSITYFIFFIIYDYKKPKEEY